MALTPRSRTPWLRTSRNPMSRSDLTARATSGVTCCAQLTCVWTARSTPRSLALAARRSRPSRTSSCRKCCGMPIRPLVARRMSRMFSMSSSCAHERLEPLDGKVRHVAAGDDHVPNLRRPAQVVEHGVPPFLLLDLELVLQELRRVVADEVHARAVAAVLRARAEQLGEHLGGVAVGEALDGPHVGLVQRVARRHRVVRPLGVAVGEGRRHVPANTVAAEVLDRPSC